jgi:tRNA1(Val) A37 N6-methylase TrmN6
VRNPTVTPMRFEQRLTERARDVIAPPMRGSRDAPLLRPSAPPIDRERVADLASEILAAAIKLAATLEAARAAGVQIEEASNG